MIDRSMFSPKKEKSNNRPPDDVMMILIMRAVGDFDDRPELFSGKAGAIKNNKYHRY